MMPRMNTSVVRRILITGMSGTGKSSVIERLAELGYTATRCRCSGVLR